MEESLDAVMGIRWAMRLDMCVCQGGARRGLLHARDRMGPCFPLGMTENPDPAPPAVLLSQAGPQATALGSGVCEGRETLENFPQMSLFSITHACMYQHLSH